MKSPFWTLGYLLILALCRSLPARADITPASLFTDNAVLQRGMPIPVWGTAEPGEKITVTLSDKSATALAGADGKWSVKLPPMPAGSPYELRMTGSKSQAVMLANVAIGEVWLCSGQSNMEYPLNGMSPDAITRATVPTVNDPLLRFAKVARVLAPKPNDSVAVKWEPATPKPAEQWSAVAYYFARDLRKALNVPVGIIESAFGGTFGQNWLSKEALEAEPSLAYYLDAEAIYVNTTYPKLLKDYTETLLPKYQADKAAYDAAQAAGNPLPPAPRRPREPQPPGKWQGAPMQLFNGMINPLIPYAIRGAAWYQGEGNWNMGYEYKTLLPALIKDWRSRWGQGDFPFFVVQLPPNQAATSQPERSWWAEVREAQRLASVSLPNTAIVVTTDVGDVRDIHPYRKEPVGQRLALLARSMAYDEKIEASGPLLDSVSIQGSTVRVKFSHADGLHTGRITDHLDTGPEIVSADKVAGFTLAGADGQFYNAEAKIEGSTVVVSSPQVPAPVGVRYGWNQFPQANLQNAAGLWASPFETGDNRWISQPKVMPTRQPATPVATAPVIAPVKAATAAQVPTAITNGDFESGNMGWSIREKVAMTSIVPEAARSGHGGMRVNDQDAKLGSSAFSSPVAITPGRGLKLTFWARNDTDNSGSLSFWFSTADNKDLPDYRPFVLLKKSEDWTKYELVAAPPAGAATARIWVHANSGSTTKFDIDDLSVEVADASLAAGGNQAAEAAVAANGTGIPATLNPRKAPPVIAWKLDDLTTTGRGDVPPGWLKVVSLLQERKVKASIGLICKSLETGSPEYINWIKGLNASGQFEFWNHGYEHKEFEFKGPSVEEQKALFNKCQTLAREKLGFTLAAFNPPYGNTDDNTVAAIAQVPELKIWMYGKHDKSGGKIIMERMPWFDLEAPTFVPNFERFVRSYNAYNETNYFVLQGHPAMWNDERFNNFVKILDFLTSQKAVFVTVSEAAARENLTPG